MKEFGPDNPYVSHQQLIFALEWPVGTGGLFFPLTEDGYGFTMSWRRGA